MLTIGRDDTRCDSVYHRMRQNNDFCYKNMFVLFAGCSNLRGHHHAKMQNKNGRYKYICFREKISSLKMFLTLKLVVMLPNNQLNIACIIYIYTYTYTYIFMYVYIYIYRVSQEERTILREGVP
jgi:hypothetical protein